MVAEYSAELIGLGTSLGELVLKETVTSVSSKIKATKNERDINKIRNTYDEIVNQLLSEREEAIRIAQVYKSELDKVQISDEDITYLHNSVSKVIGIIKEIQIREAEPEGEDAVALVEKQAESYEEIKELISVDTLKTMQLLGFNYKIAIGEPLTTVVRNLILSKAVQTDSVSTVQKMITPEMVELLKSKTAFDNFNKMIGNT